jgi:steroid 5-alpha reductase family enzyme
MIAMSKLCVLIILAAGLLGCSVGFKKFVWFMSVGYGLAMSCIAAALCVLALVHHIFAIPALAIPFLAICAVIFIYGLRLGLFLLIRETKNAAYRKTLASAGGDKKMGFPILLSMWFMNAGLFLMQSSPLYYRLQNISRGDAESEIIFLWIGFGISLAGLLIEAVSDAQKSAQKKENPDMVATKGLFRLCRCPNYFGEILVWTGVFVSGIPVLRGWLQWVVAVIGYICIVYIMFSGAKRLELRQTKRCWKMPEYVEYANKTPIIIPFLPIYHLIDWRQ